MMNINKLRYLLLLISITLLACEPKEESAEFDRGPILINLSDTLIIPAYEAVIDEVKKFDIALQQFKSSSNQSNLENLQASWLALALSWKEAEVFNFGPIQDLLIVSSIDYIAVDTAGINQAILAYDGQPDYLVSQGSHKKGIAAIEYVLFQKEQSLLSVAEQGKYLQYLALLSSDLLIKINEVLKTWTDGYQKQFIQSTGNTASAALTLVSNQMIFLSEQMKNIKLGIPMAKTAVTIPSPEKVEAPYSRTSLLLLRRNVEALKMVFNGGEGAGFDDYIKALGIEDEGGMDLADRINQQFDAVLDASDKINTSLFKAVEQNDPNLDQLYLEMINLTIMLKTDMMSQLGLLTVFSDNDGD